MRSRLPGVIEEVVKLVATENARHTRAVRVTCDCCGRYSVEEILVPVPPYGVRKRLRLRGPTVVRDYANPEELAAVLARLGVRLWAT